MLKAAKKRYLLIASSSASSCPSQLFKERVPNLVEPVNTFSIQTQGSGNNHNMALIGGGAKLATKCLQ